MAHVQIRTDEHGSTSLLIDGVDISKHVLHEGFSIVPAAFELGGPPMGWEIHCVLRARLLDLDLPESIVIADPAPEAN